MANIKSAKKRVKVNAKKAANNKARNSALKTAIKKANAAIETNADDKDVLVKDAIRLQARTLSTRPALQERRAILQTKLTRRKLQKVKQQTESRIAFRLFCFWLI